MTNFQYGTHEYMVDYYGIESQYYLQYKLFAPVAQSDRATAF